MSRLSLAAWLPRFRDHVRTPLYANAYTLVLNQVASAGLGLLYWLLAARTYPADLVGSSSALISSVIFLSVLTQFSLKPAMVRFLPRAGANAGRLVAATYAIAMAAAGIAGAVVFLLGGRVPLADALLGTRRGAAAWLVAAAMLWSVFYIQDGVLVGLRRAPWVLIENGLYNVLKIVLLLLGVRFLFGDPIAGSWFLPVPVTVAMITVLVFTRFLPRREPAAADPPRPLRAREMIASVTGDHVGSLMAEACVRLLPLLVVAAMGNASNAYFYQAWTMASTLYLLATNMASAFTVEAAADPARIGALGRKILRQMALVLVPMAAGLFLLAPFVLGLFGAEYAREGTPLLRWLAAAMLPVIVNTWYLSYARVRGRVGAIILTQALLLALTMGLAAWWLPSLGLAGVGLAWLAAQGAVAVLSGARSLRVLAGGAR